MSPEWALFEAYSSKWSPPIASEIRSHKNVQKVNGGLLPFHFDKSIVPTSHVEDWNF